jgi:hypothetical protein
MRQINDDHSGHTAIDEPLGDGSESYVGDPSRRAKAYAFDREVQDQDALHGAMYSPYPDRPRSSGGSAG